MTNAAGVAPGGLDAWSRRSHLPAHDPWCLICSKTKQRKHSNISVVAMPGPSGCSLRFGVRIVAGTGRSIDTGSTPAIAAVPLQAPRARKV